MRSSLPKVLHPLGGRPLLAHVIARAHDLSADAIHVVIGHGAHLVRKAFADTGVNWVLQEEQLGTGHAVAQALPGIPDDHVVLVMYGDVPLIQKSTLGRCVTAEQGFVGLLTAELPDPTGYDRILHHADGGISGIVEQKDASEAERRIREINTGFVAAQAAPLRRWVARSTIAMHRANSIGDIVSSAVRDGVGVRGIQPSIEEVLVMIACSWQYRTLSATPCSRGLHACRSNSN
jgi:bifunctional UDP-N-acetylglucosamine pyrophosphorylase/glucosamine-1-phosphate N-acetyltransferase